MQSSESSYRSIFKSTFLFGFVQVFNIVMKAAINKAVAILLGTLLNSNLISCHRDIYCVAYMGAS